MIGTVAVLAFLRSCLVASIPSRTGMDRSISTRSGGCASARRTASAPLRASCTWNPHMVSQSRHISRTSSVSSTRSMRCGRALVRRSTRYMSARMVTAGRDRRHGSGVVWRRRGYGRSDSHVSADSLAVERCRQLGHGVPVPQGAVVAECSSSGTAILLPGRGGRSGARLTSTPTAGSGCGGLGGGGEHRYAPRRAAPEFCKATAPCVI